MKDVGAAAVIARALGETADDARERISAIVEVLGEGASMVLLERTFATEEGMILLDPSQPTDRERAGRHSGEFFRLADKALAPSARERVRDRLRKRREVVPEGEQARVLRGPKARWEGKAKAPPSPRRDPAGDTLASTLGELNGMDVARALRRKLNH